MPEPEGRSCRINGTDKAQEPLNISSFCLCADHLSRVQLFATLWTIAAIFETFSFSLCISFSVFHLVVTVIYLPSFLVHSTLFNSKAGKMLLGYAIFWPGQEAFIDIHGWWEEKASSAS